MSDEKSLRERLSEAGKKFDGHVTNGSLDAQMKVVKEVVNAEIEAAREGRRESIRMSSAGYPIDAFNNCAECGGGPEGSMDHDTSCVHALHNDLQSTLDLIRKSDMRAIKMWQEAHPGNELVWPDRGKMIFWLLEKLEDKK